MIESLSLLEMGVFAAIVLTSLTLGLIVNRIIDRLPHRTWSSKLVDYLAPLSASIFAMGLTTLVMAVFEHLERDPAWLPLGLKLSVAWFAIRLVMLMTSKKTAGWVASIVVMPITLLHLFDVWTPLLKILKSWKFSLGTFDLSAYLLVKTVITIAILIWLAGFITNIAESRLRKLRSLRASNRVLILKILQIITYFLVFIVVLQVLGVDLTALSVFGGALGVGLGFGLQKIASNFISGIILLFEKSIEVDDMVELDNGTTGFIRHTGARYTLLETLDGREILIPNEDFITQRTSSWTYSSKKARVEIRVSVGYDCDLHQARALMLEAARKHPKCIPSPAPMCVVDNFGDSGIGLILHFWVGDVTDGRMEPKSEVMLAIWDAFKANKITIPYPQQVIRVEHETKLPFESNTEQKV